MVPKEWRVPMSRLFQMGSIHKEAWPHQKNGLAKAESPE